MPTALIGRWVLSFAGILGAGKHSNWDKINDLYPAKQVKTTRSQTACANIMEEFVYFSA